MEKLRHRAVKQPLQVTQLPGCKCRQCGPRIYILTHQAIWPQKPTIALEVCFPTTKNESAFDSTTLSPDTEQGMDTSPTDRRWWQRPTVSARALRAVEQWGAPYEGFPWLTTGCRPKGLIRDFPEPQLADWSSSRWVKGQKNIGTASSESPVHYAGIMLTGKVVIKRHDLGPKKRECSEDKAG